MAHKDIIDFATWYSGMDREKVERAYLRYTLEIKREETTEMKGCAHEWDEGFHGVCKCKKCGKFSA